MEPPVDTSRAPVWRAIQVAVLVLLTVQHVVPIIGLTTPFTAQVGFQSIVFVGALALAWTAIQQGRRLAAFGLLAGWQFFNIGALDTAFFARNNLWIVTAAGVIVSAAATWLTVWGAATHRARSLAMGACARIAIAAGLYLIFRPRPSTNTFERRPEFGPRGEELVVWLPMACSVIIAVAALCIDWIETSHKTES